MEKLNSFALNIEFLLISVVQGVALAALAASAVTPITSLEFQYWPYIIASFIVILSFWSEAIIHAVSFIDWPLDLSHSFLYFLASFIEVMAFSQIENPIGWFGFMSAFFVVAFVSYYVDLAMIKARKDRFVGIKRQKLYDHILKRQIFEMKIFLPAATIFCLGSFFAILFHQDFFITHKWNLLLISIQTIFGIIILAESMKSFKRRALLVTESAK